MEAKEKACCTCLLATAAILLELPRLLASLSQLAVSKQETCAQRKWHIPTKLALLAKRRRKAKCLISNLTVSKWANINLYQRKLYFAAAAQIGSTADRCSMFAGFEEATEKERLSSYKASSEQANLSLSELTNK